jgi:glutaminyl-tRNA synthetase
MNPDSLKILTDCYIEPFVKNGKPLDHFQFERLGYFNLDLDSTMEKPVFNLTVQLRDSWAREQNKN